MEYPRFAKCAALLASAALAACGGSPAPSTTGAPSTLSELVSAASADLTPPSTPSNLTWANDGLTVTLTWSPSTDDVGVVGYDLLYGSFFLGTFSDTTLALIGFKPGTPYVFTVKARDAAGNLSVASNATTVLLAAPKDSTPPSAPTSLKAVSVTDTRVSLSWTASTDDTGVVVYQVYSGASVVGTALGSTTATVSGLSPSTPYVFTVTALDAAGNVSQASAALSVTTQAVVDTTPPSAPTGLTASNVATTSVTLSWSASTDNVAVTGYTLYNGASIAASTSGLSASVSGLSPGTTYGFTVVAKDAAGNTSASSSTVSVTTISASQNISINVGGAATGSFIADADFSGGTTYSNTNTIDTSAVSSAVPAAVFQSERYGPFTYTVPGLTAGGPYVVTLYFAETYLSAAGARLFDVAINGAKVLSSFDIYAAAGAQNKAVAQSFNATADGSGQVTIAFTVGALENPKVCGISVASGVLPTYTLSVTKSGAGSGTVSGGGISCGGTCTASVVGGSTVTLTATPTSDSTFDGWGGACTGTSTCTVSMTAAKTVTASFSAGGTWPPSSTFSNPVLWEDLADIDIIRVGDAYYYSASTMHYSPGAPILRSYDLVNWEYIGHSVPVLDWGNAYNMSGGRAYVKGIYASSIAYRKSNSTWYWIGCTEYNRTYIYTSTDVAGTWSKQKQLSNCYYDVGLLIDTDDTMYVAYGNTQLSVAQLSSDGLSQVKSQQVFDSSSAGIGTLEGSRFYKINGNYYIFATKPANGQYVLKASSPWGPYTSKQLLLNIGTPVSGGGTPHQGGLVQTQNGDWYYLAFVDSYPGGRIPVLAPITWGSDGFPTITTVNNAWGASYPYPNVPRPPYAAKPLTGTDTFTGAALGPEWEWNHNPDNTKWTAGGKLTLQTATVTSDLYNARNTLSHRILGPTSTATIVLNYGNMKDGDRAGFALLRDSSAWIGVKRDSGAYRVSMTSGLSMDSNWATTGTGSEVAGAATSGGKIWLRIAADIHVGSGKQGKFSYSTDGVNFTQLGTFTMGNAWQFFMGYRYAIFNYATSALGGSVTVDSFTMTTP
jgi:beta-xylosidase/chitodextrinase